MDGSPQQVDAMPQSAMLLRRFGFRVRRAFFFGDVWRGGGNVQWELLNLVRFGEMGKWTFFFLKMFGKA